jgi:hypothetical protein
LWNFAIWRGSFLRGYALPVASTMRKREQLFQLHIQQSD